VREGPITLVITTTGELHAEHALLLHQRKPGTDTRRH
jgi:hypothetical protein